ncbi:MAG: cobalamin B12-binding domain-containing protein [Deltaproteobacteria bacterium]|nr:cobalamin B12-binding domain-containing protein [Deltaproteobacteria bacterium]
MPDKPIRVLVAKPGLDGHDVGAKVVALALRDAGMEVVYTGLHQTPERIARAAQDEAVDVVGLSVLSGAHVVLTRRVAEALRARGLGRLPIVVGGVIPRPDEPGVREAGAAAVFPTQTPFDAIVAGVRRAAGREPPAAAGTGPETLAQRRRDAEEETAASVPTTKPPVEAPSPSPIADRRPPTADRRPTAPRPVLLESGIDVKPVYGPEDVAGLDYARDLGAPGTFPFVRGIHPLMYRAQPFTMRQYAGFGTPADTNRRFKLLIGQGQNALNVAFDLPTQNGLDSDDPRAEGEVGRVGMAIDTLADMEQAFDGIDLAKISVSLTINPLASVLIAMYVAVAERRGVPRDRIRGTAQNDILKEYVGRGTWIYPVEPSLRLIADTVEYGAKELPRYNPVSVCGYHMRESGATPVQEMAWAFLIAEAYARRVLERGIPIDEFAPRLSFNFDIHGNLFEQVAKFRAGRRVYAHLMRDELGAKDERSMVVRMIAGGGGGGLTIEQPENNIVRSAFYALASALSGTQTMALCCYDEAYTIPSEHASLLALRTMQVVAEETGASDTVDPLGGSYYVEALTNEMERRIREEMRRVREGGGIVRQIADGTIQRLVAVQSYRRQQDVREGRVPVVGVNRHRIEEEERKVELHPYDVTAAEEKIAGLRRVKASRDPAAVGAALDALRTQAKGTANLMPFLLDAVKAYATVGEIAEVFRDVFGEFEEPRALT